MQSVTHHRRYLHLISGNRSRNRNVKTVHKLHSEPLRHVPPFITQHVRVTVKLSTVRFPFYNSLLRTCEVFCSWNIDTVDAAAVKLCSNVSQVFELRHISQLQSNSRPGSFCCMVTAFICCVHHQLSTNNQLSKGVLAQLKFGTECIWIVCCSRKPKRWDHFIGLARANMACNAFRRT